MPRHDVKNKKQRFCSMDAVDNDIIIELLRMCKLLRRKTANRFDDDLSS